MEYRELGRTSLWVSAIGFGAWPIGGGWGDIDDEQAMATLHAAIDAGVNFIDTADVYGRSEQLVGRLLRERTERIYVATKAGRRLQPHEPSGYTYENLRRFAESSREALGVPALDLLQLHTPPTATFWQPRTFEALERLKDEGIIRHAGASVETVDEACQALQYPVVEVIQIVFNLFRQRPLHTVFPMAKTNGLGILARVPLASGLLAGKLTRETTFGPEDPRTYNRHGEYFDVGEVFSGVEFEQGLEAVEELRRLVPEGASMAQFALRWILMHDAVCTVIPGAKSASQARENAAAAHLPPLSDEQMQAARGIYDRRIRPTVHHRW